MSVRSGSDWSGFVTVNTLPAENLGRMGLNARLVEHARQTPNPSFTESYASRQFGVPVVAESLAGGAVAVSVNSFSKFQPGPRVVPATDEWDRKRVVENSFHQFFGDYIHGRMRVTESLPSYSRPVGPVSYGSRNRQRGRPSGVPSWYAPLPGEPSSNDDAGLYGGRNHPGYGGYSQSWLGKEEARLHDGDCGSVHPYQTHADWASSEEEEEESRQRLRARAKEGYLRTLITESDHQTNCPLRKWAIRKLAQRQ